MPVRALIVLVACIGAIACADAPAPLTISGSAVGREADILSLQLARFREAHPGTPVALRATPDDANLRHQLYAQWLNARAADPDVLQLDVIWTAEFAAAGWIAPLTRFAPDEHDYFSPSVDAHRWRGTLYALPWFIDVGMLYWRTDLMADAPRDLSELDRLARDARARGDVPFGLVWQGARYEGLVTVFLEYLAAHGGAILDAGGRVTVDEDPAVRALEAMCAGVRDGFIPSAVLGWQEEQTRFAFQNGQAAFMRNWPYARPLLNDAAQSAVAGKFAIAAMPAGPGGEAVAALGGSALAINAFSDRADQAWELVRFLLEPEQMVERARLAGQYPSRPSLYETRALADALQADPSAIRQIVEHAVARPSTPVYAELSELLQVALHRALTGQETPRDALLSAGRDIRALLARAGLSPVAP